MKQLNDTFEEPEPFDTWSCYLCNSKFVDVEDNPFTSAEEAASVEATLQTMRYWLGTNEPVCRDCAIDAGIPPIDEEE